MNENDTLLYLTNAATMIVSAFKKGEIGEGVTKIAELCDKIEELAPKEAAIATAMKNYASVKKVSSFKCPHCQSDGTAGFTCKACAKDFSAPIATSYFVR
jgi:hypothetical protein